MKTPTILVKNFLSLAASELVSKAISVISTAYLARIIMPEGYGTIGFAVAVVSYLVNIVIFGTDTIAVRDLSNDRKSLSKYFSNIITLRVVISIFLVILIYPLTAFVSPDLQSVQVLNIILLSLFMHAISSEFILQAIERMEIIALSNILKSIFLLTGYMIFVTEISDVSAAAWVFTISGILTSFVFTVYASISISKFRFLFECEFIKYIMRESYPLFVSAIAIAVYYNMDMIMLGFIKTEYEVGIYNAAYRIFLFGTLPILLLLKSFLPKLSRIFEAGESEFWNVLNRYVFSIMLFGIASAVAIFFGGKLIIKLVFGMDYMSAVGPLSLLSINILVVAVNVSLGNPLTAWGYQKLYSLAIISGALVNIFLNILLIPQYSYVGAAFATLLSELVVFIGLFFVFNRVVQRRSEIL